MIFKFAERLKKIGSPAPFGRGLNSTINPSLRQGWQIEGNKVSIPVDEEEKNFSLKTRPALVKLAMTQLGLPVDVVAVEANLNQMLLYDSGGHCVKHKLFVKGSGNNI